MKSFSKIDFVVVFWNIFLWKYGNDASEKWASLFFWPSEMVISIAVHLIKSNFQRVVWSQQRIFLDLKRTEQIWSFFLKCRKDQPASFCLCYYSFLFSPTFISLECSFSKWPTCCWLPTSALGESVLLKSSFRFTSAYLML